MFVGFDMVAGFRSLWPWLTLPLVLAPADPARSSCTPTPPPLQAVPKAEKGRINKETQIANAEGILGVERKDKNRSGET